MGSGRWTQWWVPPVLASALWSIPPLGCMLGIFTRSSQANGRIALVHTGIGCNQVWVDQKYIYIYIHVTWYWTVQMFFVHIVNMFRNIFLFFLKGQLSCEQMPCGVPLWHTASRTTALTALKADAYALEALQNFQCLDVCLSFLLHSMCVFAYIYSHNTHVDVQMYNVFSFCGSFLSEMYKYIYIYI